MNFNVTLVVVSIVCIFSCNKAIEKVDDATAKNPNRETVVKLFEAFNKHDWDGYAGYYAADADFLDPSFGNDYVQQTHQQIVDKYLAFEKISPDIKDEVVGIYDIGEKVIVEFVAGGTAPDGTKWRLPICSVLTIKDGKVIRDATYFDEEK